jgi:hypothetical protein
MERPVREDQQGAEVGRLKQVSQRPGGVLEVDSQNDEVQTCRTLSARPLIPRNGTSGNSPHFFETQTPRS